MMQNTKKLTMDQFMSAIWDHFGKVTIPLINGSVVIFRDDPRVNSDAKQCYWIQYSEDEILAVIPFNTEVFVNYEGELIIPKEYVIGNKADLVLRFYQKSPRLDILQYL